MKNKQILLVFVVGALLNLNAFIACFNGVELDELIRKDKQNRIAVNVKAFRKRAIHRKKTGGIDNNGNTNLHDMADNCAIFSDNVAVLAENVAKSFYLNPFLINKNGQQAIDILDQNLNRFPKGSEAYNNCAFIRSLVIGLEKK